MTHQTQLALCAALMIASSVWAQTLQRQWGGFGSENGKFVGSAGIAVEGNRVYVVDGGNDRIQVFDRSGNFLGKWGSQGRGDGQFEAAFGIAVAGSEVFVTDVVQHNVQVFDLDGKFLRKWGSAGAGAGQFHSPLGLAVLGSEVYVADGGNNLVQVFEKSGAFRRQWIWRPPTFPNPPEFNFPHFVAASGDSIFVSGGTSIVGGGSRLRLFDRDGTFLQFWIDRLQQAWGVAVHAGTAYVASDYSILPIDLSSDKRAGFQGFTDGGPFFAPFALAIHGNELYVTGDSRVLVFRLK